MCGIVGGFSTNKNIVPFILNGLQALEYRGYDSAGIVTVKNNKLWRERMIGSVQDLKNQCEGLDMVGNIALGHTRWATHGAVTIDNTHPHLSHHAIAIVHNGIIENYHQLKEEVLTMGYEISTQTDTELIAHLIYNFYKENQDLLVAVKLAIKKIKGSYAFAVIANDNSKQIVTATHNSPLLLAFNQDGIYFASDLNALLPESEQILFIKDGDIVNINNGNYEIINQDQIVSRPIIVYNKQQAAVSLGEYQHFMEKEIFEQNITAADTINYLGQEMSPHIFGVNADKIFKSVKGIQIIACGTSYYAGLVAHHWIQQYANIPCQVSIASEYVYSYHPHEANNLIVSISQSGETADTIKAVKHAYSLGIENTLTICNVAHSTLVRISKLFCLTQAGIEVGVASTKAFTTQLIALIYLTFALAKSREVSFDESKLINTLNRLPNLIINIIEQAVTPVKQMALSLQDKAHALFLGRNVLLPIAHEAALKIKEVAYIHSESYAAGELKHGPIALVDSQLPVFVLLSRQVLIDQSWQAVQQVLARNGDVYIISDNPITNTLGKDKVFNLSLPQDIPVYLIPILFTIPLQMLAYYTALFKGTNIDKPRNLAKSVTVE